MWFGNLATPEWWDNIILKESTVSWFMVFAADHTYGDFNYADEYMVLYELIVSVLVGLVLHKTLQ